MWLEQRLSWRNGVNLELLNQVAVAKLVLEQKDSRIRYGCALPFD